MSKVLEGVDPERTFAILVGVETYGHRALQPLDGPCLDALGHARWLRKNGVPGENIRLCASPMEHNRSDTEAAARDLGIRLYEATQVRVWEVVDGELPTWHGDLLWFAWSGHGALAPGTKQQLLFYADAEPYREVTLSTENLQHALLHNPRYRGIRHKVLLVDACRDYNANVEGLAGYRLSSTSPIGVSPSLVMSLYATQDGMVASEIPGRGGGFTFALLKELDAAPCWPPDPAILIERVRARMEETSTSIPYVDARFWNGDLDSPGRHTPRFGPVVLPAKPMGFAGRKDELERLLTYLTPSGDGKDATTVTITGMAGVGKTALALASAHEARSRGWFPGGIVYLDLQGFSTDSPLETEAAAEQLLRALKIPSEQIPVYGESRASLWRSHLDELGDSNRPVLLILDNASAVAQVSDLLPSFPHRVVITSRNKLSSLPAADFALHALGSDAALDLLSRVLHLADPDDQRIDASPDHAVRLASLCGGLPLALRIIAALLRDEPDRPITELTSELADDARRLDALTYSDVDEWGQPMVVRAAFDVSYRRLQSHNSQASRLFRLLTCDPGPDLSTEVAAALLDESAVQTRRLLSVLVRAHLVEKRGIERWGMHDLIRLYASQTADHRAAEDLQETAATRMRAHYAKTSSAANTHVRSLKGANLPDRFADEADAFAWLDANHRNLVALIQRDSSKRHTQRDMMVIGSSLAPYLVIRRHLDEALSVTEAWIAAARKCRVGSSEANGLVMLGDVLHKLRRFKDAASTSRATIDLARALGNRLIEGEAHISYASALAELKRPGPAIDSLEEAARLFRELGYRHSEAIALLSLCAPLVQLERYEKAVSGLNEAITIFQEFGDLDREGDALTNRGVAFMLLGRHQDALKSHEAALAIQRSRFRSRYDEARILVNIFSAYSGLHRWEEAIGIMDEAISIFREYEDRVYLPQCLSELSCALSFHSLELSKSGERTHDAKLASARALDVAREAIESLGPTDRCYGASLTAFAEVRVEAGEEMNEAAESAIEAAKHTRSRQGTDSYFAHLADKFEARGDVLTADAIRSVVRMS
ncbi:tetratricopeptide repeat protein [Streptomyces sp. NPDC001792]|uniref:tetratricopeptide repeat protein n=1 Tax=Streptomyces sp. NPDC001792 TaxID=3154524 RepID=UPI00332D9328